MRASMMALAVVVVASLLTACGGGSGKSTPTTTGTVPPSSPTSTATADGGANGIAGIFPAMFAALAADDAGPLTELMTLTKVPCITTPQGLDSEPLCTGQPAGSLVAAFPFAKCQGAFVAADRAPAELFNDVSSNAAYASLYAIYRTEGSHYTTGFFAPAAAEAVAVFTGVGDVLNTDAWALLLHDGHIVGFDGGCNEKLADFISTRKLTTLVEPPALRHTSLPDVDTVIDAVLSGDPVQLRPLLAFQPMACTATPQGIGPFYCSEGEKDGTVVDVLPTAQCEGSFLRADEMDRLTFVTNPSFELFAVYQSGQDYTAVFRRAIAQRLTPEVLALQIENGRITSINFGCGQTPDEYVARVQPQDFVLPPP